MTVRGSVTLQFVRLSVSTMVPIGARRRALEKNHGARRRTAARIVLGPSRSLKTSGRSKRGKSRVTTPTAGTRVHGIPSPQA